MLIHLPLCVDVRDAFLTDGALEHLAEHERDEKKKGGQTEYLTLPSSAEEEEEEAEVSLLAEPKAVPTSWKKEVEAVEPLSV